MAEQKKKMTMADLQNRIAAIAETDTTIGGGTPGAPPDFSTHTAAPDLATTQNAGGTGLEQAATDNSPSGAQPGVDSQPAAVVEQPPVGEAGGTQSPAADVTPDPWADAEEVEYEEDGGEKFKVRVPKGYSQKARDGWSRRSVMDRNARYLSAARATLEPLITSGRFRDIQPLLDLALQDQEFSNFVTEAYGRRVSGMPLVAQAEREAAAAGAASQATANPAAPLIEDPFLNEVLSPLHQQMQSQAQEIQQMRQAEAQRQQQFQMQQRAQQDAQRLRNQVVNEMRTLYPTDFNGDEQAEQAQLVRLYNYANNAGYFQSYGYNPAVYRLAYQELNAQRASAASPAVNQLDAIQANARARAAEAAARSVAPGAVATTEPAQKPKSIFEGIKTKDANGRSVPLKQLVANVERRMANAR